MTYWIQITSGRGPEECCWVTARLSENIVKEAEASGIHCDVIDVIPGEKPNTAKSVLMSVEGDNVKAFSESLEGTIQWIGKSMFRPNHRRMNWFVGVDTFSPPKNNEQPSKEFKIERMRSSGPGGQHANKTETAIRITHVPTGLTATAQEERSQYLNKKLAFSRLTKLMDQKEERIKMKMKNNLWNNHNRLERGNPVRVYEDMEFRLKNR